MLPISVAPLDGREILVLDNGRWYAAKWHSKRSRWERHTSGEVLNPTHWREP